MNRYVYWSTHSNGLMTLGGQIDQCFDLFTSCAVDNLSGVAARIEAVANINDFLAVVRDSS